MIGAAPEVFFGHFLDAWTKEPSAIPAEVRATYLAAARSPEAIQAICADYRASAFADSVHDEQDRAAVRRLQMPVTALWQDPGDIELPFDPATVWEGWAPKLRTAVLDCGIFFPKNAPARSRPRYGN